MPGPLTGVRVVDLTRALAGPYSQEEIQRFTDQSLPAVPTIVAGST